MKMRLLEVVSSSVSLMHDSTDQLTASVVSRCCSTRSRSVKGCGVRRASRYMGMRALQGQLTVASKRGG